MGAPNNSGLLDISLGPSDTKTSAASNGNGDNQNNWGPLPPSSSFMLQPPAAPYGDDFLSDLDSGDEEGLPDYDDIVGGRSDSDGERPPGYVEDGQAVPGTMTGGPSSSSSSRAAAAAVMVEPQGLIINGQSILLHQGAAPLSQQPASYSLNRGIASLSHSDTSVEFQRVDHVVAGRAGSPSKEHVTARSRHIYDLHHVDEHQVNLMIKGHSWAMSPHDSLETIPRFWGLATTKRCWGSFGLRQIRSDRYAVTPLAKRRGKIENGELPRFATGEKKEGTGFAKSVFEARVVSTSHQVGSGEMGGGTSGSMGSKFKGFSLSGKGKGKASAKDEQSAHNGGLEWEWLDEFGTVVAHEDWVVFGDQYMPRLITTAAMRRELFDVLVSSWCLRLWWQNADRVAPHEGGFTGFRRKLKLVPGGGIGPRAIWGAGDGRLN